jgi:hypothetical protein
MRILPLRTAMNTKLSPPARLRAARTFVICTIVLGLAVSVARGQSDVKGSYIDNAIPMDQFRLRYESVDGINRSDRAEFIYAKGFDPDIKYQDVSTYLELVVVPRLSAFVELHEHMVDPTVAPSNTGFGDMNAGFKYALLMQDDQVLSFLMRTYIPTGLPKDSILGTGHVSLDPAVLYFQQVTDRLAFLADFHDFIPIGGSDFQGNVIRYGAGLSYDVLQRERYTVTPVAEFLGWTVLSGRESLGQTPAGDLISKSAAGDTIINAKMGLRLGFGDHSDLYIGYARALTGTVWYKDMFRIELRYKF